ncbi:MAG: nucleotidyltransferase domain-containing protein [Gammaproteobacteria bacterium]|nr:nucleotidyltransferase domain-containing protein [Gammaproteobacteria bacterium]
MVQQRRPVEVLFSRYHRRILALLLLQPEQRFYVREIARLADIPAGSVHRELKRLAESGILLREPAANQVLYRANRDCPIYPELAGIFVKTAGLADVLRDALDPLAGELDLAFVFGSIAQSAETATSDVDLFVVGRASFADVVKATAQCSERLGREVNPVVMKKADFLNKYRQGDRFVRRIVKEPKIFILGTSDEFGELVKDRSA